MPVDTTAGRARTTEGALRGDHEPQVLRGLREHPAGGGEAEIDGGGGHGSGRSSGY
nr:hypothetical protein [Deltaproteobacteria bacterium]